MSDLIVRQDVLNELDGCDYELKDWQRWKLKTMVRDIPSAQPVNYGSTKSDSSSQLKLNNDLISRQAAMVVIENTGLDDDSKDTVVRVLEQLPSAQPEITKDDVKEYCRKRCLIVVTSDFYNEMYRRWSSAQSHRKRGRWVELSKGILFHDYKCDQCGNTIDMNGINAGRGDANYCPNCGARMEGGRNG